MNGDSNPTAAVMLIGNEILSGRTQDLNLQFIAKSLAEIGVRLCECRVVTDDADAIIEALNTLRERYTYLFTTGGIGPTHDDITAQCVANAFGVPLLQHPEAVARLTAYFDSRGVEANEARMRMANVPQGGTLIDNAVSVAPGFRLANVHVMAGVPRIMQSMFEQILPTLTRGTVVKSVSVVCNLPEGELSAPLEQLQQQFPQVEIGSYPGKRHGAFPRVTLVGRGTDDAELSQLLRELHRLVSKLGGQIEDQS